MNKRRAAVRGFGDTVKNSINLEGKSAFVNPESTIYYPEPVWDDIRIAATSGKLAGTNDPIFSKIIDNGAGSRGVYTYLFEYHALAAQEDEIHFTIQLPHGYAEGTDLYPHIHWCSPTTPVNKNIVWALEYTWYNYKEVIPNTEIITGTFAVSTAFSQEMAQLSKISGAGKKISSMLSGRLFRNSSSIDDTYTTEGIYLLEIDFHYQSDSPGSLKIASKV